MNLSRTGSDVAEDRMQSPEPPAEVAGSIQRHIGLAMVGGKCREGNWWS